MANESVHVYPNPIQAGALLKGNLNQGDEYRIVDMQGKVWKQGHLSGDGIDCLIPAGLYIFQVRQGEQILTERIQIIP